MNKVGEDFKVRDKSGGISFYKCVSYSKNGVILGEKQLTKEIGRFRLKDITFLNEKSEYEHLVDHLLYAYKGVLEKEDFVLKSGCKISNTVKGVVTEDELLRLMNSI